MNLDSGAVVAAEVHPAGQGNTTTIPGTLASAAEHLAALDVAPTPEDPAELVADKSYHSRAGLRSLEDGPWKSRIAESQRDEFLRWHGDDAALRAVYNNRARLLSGVARQAFKLRAELVERGFALTLDRGGLRDRKKVENPRCRLQSRPIMRLLTGAGTPRELAAQNSAWANVILMPDSGLTAALLLTVEDQTGVLVVSIQADPYD